MATATGVENVRPDDLIKVTGRTMSYARDAAAALDKRRCFAIASEIRHYLDLAGRVVDQTQRRALGGESVPASEKIVSIFEAHTDIIVKDRRQTLYGHKVALTTGRSGLVIDFVVLEGNPADSPRRLQEHLAPHRDPPAQQAVAR